MLTARRNRTLDVSVHDGNRNLSRHAIKAVTTADIVLGFIRAGTESLHNLLIEKVQEPEQDVLEDEQTNDHDPVLGAQVQDARRDVGQKDADKPMSWNTIRREVIPPFVKAVAFTVDSESMDTDRREQLRSQFPEVIITPDCTKARKVAEKPKGVMRMTIELDESELAENPKLDSAVREQFPWASIDSRTGPNTSRRRTIQAVESISVSSRRLDPIKHLNDLAGYTSEPPSDDAFGYLFPVSNGWDQLPYARKLEVAHAQAIQGLYGKVAEGNGCSNCTKQGYDCKVYRPQLGNLSHMSFGHSCQHCRLRRTQCDLPAAIKARPTKASLAPLVSFDAGTQTLRGPAGDRTPSAAATPPKGSLVTRMSGGSSKMLLDTRTNEDHGGLSNSPRSHAPANGFETSPILECADYLNLGLEGVVRSVIHSMYGTLRRRKTIDVYVGERLSLAHHYSNLVNLYILAYAQNDLDLAFIVLLHFQYTNYHDDSMTELPNVEVATHAFKHLPYNSPLCQWIATIYCFLWPTRYHGDYDRFMNDNPGIDSTALTKLLYATTYARDPYTRGHDAGVLSSWCDVHDHTRDKPEQEALCWKMRAKTRLSLNEAIEIENNHMHDEAIAGFQMRDRLPSTHKQMEVSEPTSPSPTRKRKAEGTSPYPDKKSNRGRGRGRGRGYSR